MNPLSIPNSNNQHSVSALKKKAPRGSSFKRYIKKAIPLAIAPFMFAPKASALEPLTQDKIEWNKNIKVLASVPEHSKSYSVYLDSLKPENPQGSYYAHALRNRFASPKCKSLEDAHASLVGSGYAQVNSIGRKFTAYPVQTPRKLDCFNKDDTTKQRFAFIISGVDSKDPKLEQTFKYDCREMKKMLAENFNMERENFFNLSYSWMRDTYSLGDSLKDYSQDIFDKSMNQFAKRIVDSGADLDNVEILIYYAGHGLKQKNPGKKFQGGSEGASIIGWEKDVKKLLNEHPVFSKVKAILIGQDCCYSGAWIADASKNISKSISKMV